MALPPPEPKKTPESLRLREPPFALNAEQRQALVAIDRKAGQFQPWLLFGITGSGKTEIYLQAIASVLARGEQALVLVPEIGLAPQTVARFRARFQTEIAVLHSGRNERERLEAWRAARSGQAGIVIGTRSAVFTPLARPGLIIVDEEHDLSFKQHEGFRYHARDLAVRRAQLESTPIVLGSATPSLESLANARLGRYELLELKERAAGASMPVFKLIDLRQQKLQDGFSDLLLQAVKTTLARGEQVLVFINRRGFAPLLLCHDCGWQAHCRRCDARPTLHRSPVRLHCHHCGSESAPPVQCPSCGSADLRAVGLGTERAEELLGKRFPKVPLFRVDRDSTRRKDALSQLYHEIHSAGPALLVGTQMLAKGHHFPKVTLVAILDVDGGLFGADFRAPEHMAQLILQVAGRAGRADKPGLVLLQTHQPEHPLLHELITAGYSAFAERVLEERRQLGLPPFGHLALIRAEATDAARPMTFLQQIAAAPIPACSSGGRCRRPWRNGPAASAPICCCSRSAARHCMPRWTRSSPALNACRTPAACAGPWTWTRRTSPDACKKAGQPTAVAIGFPRRLRYNPPPFSRPNARHEEPARIASCPGPRHPEESGPAACRFPACHPARAQQGQGSR